jgi:hypothetical protein
MTSITVWVLLLYLTSLVPTQAYYTSEECQATLSALKSHHIGLEGECFSVPLFYQEYEG